MQLVSKLPTTALALVDTVSPFSGGDGQAPTLPQTKPRVVNLRRRIAPCPTERIMMVDVVNSNSSGTITAPLHARDAHRRHRTFFFLVAARVKIRKFSQYAAAAASQSPLSVSAAEWQVVKSCRNLLHLTYTRRFRRFHRFTTPLFKMMRSLLISDKYEHKC